MLDRNRYGFDRIVFMFSNIKNKERPKYRLKCLAYKTIEMMMMVNDSTQITMSPHFSHHLMRFFDHSNHSCWSRCVQFNKWHKIWCLKKVCNVQLLVKKQAKAVNCLNIDSHHVEVCRVYEHSIFSTFVLIVVIFYVQRQLYL